MQEQEAREVRLQQEILLDAQRKAERTVERARKEADRLLEVVSQEQLRAREAQLARAKQESEARARAVLAGIQHDVYKRWLHTRESVLDRLLADALTRAEQGAGIDRRRSLCERLAEALRAFGQGTPLKIRVAPREQAEWDAALLGAGARQAGFAGDAAVAWTVTVDPELAAGFVVESADGRERFDQTLRARLLRFKRTLRLAVAKRVGAQHLDIAALTRECQPHE